MRSFIKVLRTGLFLFLVSCSLSLVPAFTEEFTSQQTLRLSRADFLLREAQAPQALEELGSLPKDAYEDPGTQQTLAKAFELAYARERRAARARSHATSPAVSQQIENRIRVTRRKRDAEANSDQSFDDRGWQVNEHAAAQVEGPDGLRSRFVVDLDGFRDGHNDLRYRTLLADFSKGSSHLALGDSSTYPSPYFLRGSRFRGAHLLLSGEANEFQALVGAYPFWLEGRDEYIYPRMVFGARDRVRLVEDRIWLGANFAQTQDNEKIRTIDVANHPRNNLVASLDQELRLIPGVWRVKAAQSYSVTEDNLEEAQNRFGHQKRLNDSAFTVESLVTQPKFRWRSLFERTGPDFRLLTDLPSGSVVNTKGITADRRFVGQSLDLAPIGPIDLDLAASWYRNNLNHQTEVEQTRQSWYTADIGFLIPPTWPQPRVRSAFYETVSVPGSTTRPSQTRTLDLNGELHKNFWSTDGTAFATYKVEHPLKDKLIFDEDESWSFGTRLARPLGERLLLHGRYQYLFFDELFDEVRGRGRRHEADLTQSLRLWSTANLSLSYTLWHGKFHRPGEVVLARGQANLATASFNWPYRWLSPDKRRKLTLSPGFTYHISDLNPNSEDRPVLTGSLKIGYENSPDWRLELSGEFHHEHDEERDQVRSEDSRIWLLWTSRWGGKQG